MAGNSKTKIILFCLTYLISFTLCDYNNDIMCCLDPLELTSCYSNNSDECMEGYSAFIGTVIYDKSKSNRTRKLEVVGLLTKPSAGVDTILKPILCCVNPLYPFQENCVQVYSDNCPLSLNITYNNNNYYQVQNDIISHYSNKFIPGNFDIPINYKNKTTNGIYCCLEENNLSTFSCAYFYNLTSCPAGSASPDLNIFSLTRGKISNDNVTDRYQQSDPNNTDLYYQEPSFVNFPLYSCSDTLDPSTCKKVNQSTNNSIYVGPLPEYPNPVIAGADASLSVNCCLDPNNFQTCATYTGQEKCDNPMIEINAPVQMGSGTITCCDPNKLSSCINYSTSLSFNCPIGLYFSGKTFPYTKNTSIACPVNVCENGGICTIFDGSVNCACASTFFGNLCQYNILDVENIAKGITSGINDITSSYIVDQINANSFDNLFVVNSSTNNSLILCKNLDNCKNLNYQKKVTPISNSIFALIQQYSEFSNINSNSIDLNILKQIFQIAGKTHI